MMNLHPSLMLKLLSVFLVMIQWRETSALSCNISVISPVSLNGNTADNDAAITWSPLPTEVNYQSTGEYDDGGLGPYFTLARSFVNTSIPTDLPIDIISGLVDASFNFGQDYQQIIDVSLGYIACIAIGLLFIIIFTLVGLIFCCCRCCGNCGGKRVQKETSNMKCKKVTFSLILFLLIAFLSVGLICIFVNNGRMSTIVTNVEDIYNNSITDAELFVDLIKTQVKHLSVDNFQFTSDVIVRDLNGIDVLLGVRVRDMLKTQSSLDTAITEVVSLSNTLQSLSTLLLALDAGVTDVGNKVTLLGNALGGVKTTLDTNLASCGTPCNSINTTPLKTSFDTTQFPDLTDPLSKIQSTKPSDLNNTLNNATSELEDIPCRVKNESQTKISDVQTTLNDFASSSLSSVDDQIGNLSSKIDLNTYKGQGDTYFEYAKEYDVYRYYGGIGLACLVLLIIVLMLLGLVFGVCGSNSKEKPTERGCLSNSGGNMLIASVAFIFIFSWLLMLLTTLTYAVGAPLERWVCQPLTDFDSKLYTQLLDKPNGPLGNGYFLGGLIFQNDSIDLTVSGVLKDCRDSKAAYTALKLNNLFDIESKLDYSQYIDINSTLGNLGDTVDVSVNILTPAMQGNLQDIKDAVNVNTVAFLAELNKNLADTDLTVFAQDLRNLGNAVGAPNKANLDARAGEIEAIQANQYQAVQTSVAALKLKVNEFATTKVQVLTDVDSVNTTLQFTQDYFNNNNNAKDLLTQESSAYVDRLISVIDSYIGYTKNALKNDMGQCDIVYNLFASLATVGICKNFLDAFNAFWLSLGWCIFFFVPSLIFAVKLAKHFRKMTYLEDGDLFDYNSDKNVPSPLMNEMTIRIGHINNGSSSKVFPSSAHTSTTEIGDGRQSASAPPADDFHNNKVGHMDGF